jgi:hypothetical protein
MPDIYVKDASTWKKAPANGIYVRDAGIWKQADFAYMKVAGVWTLAYVSDATGPAAPTSATATWSGSGLRVAWTNPADADFSHVAVYITPAGQPYISVGTISGSPSQAKTYDFTSYIIDNAIYTVQLVPYDTNGNAGTTISFDSMGWTGAARGRTPLSTYIDPTDSGTWRNGAWRSDIPAKDVYQGIDAFGHNTGVYFYGTQFYDKLRGSTISAATIEVYRANGVGFGSNRSAMLWTSTCTSKASDPTATIANNFASNVMSINGNASRGRCRPSPGRGSPTWLAMGRRRAWQPWVFARRTPPSSTGTGSATTT